MALVFDDESVEGPATHVLVIGVGHYPHLPGGGDAQRAVLDVGMRQLSSPPVSARNFADWVITRFHNPRRPLASVEMLLGDQLLSYERPARAGFPAATMPTGGATLKEMSDAAIRWKKRGNKHPDNLLIFYFCGHGLSKGDDFGIVASDYGHSEDLPLDGMVDVPKFLLAMQDCEATDQCYFFDACRASDESLVETENYGNALVQKIAAAKPGMHQCVYYSTLGGAVAHGRKGQASFYTRALLQALNGSAAENSAGPWQVNTARLFEAISHLMREMADQTLPKVQVPQSGSQVMFDFHQLQCDPELPFLLGVDNHVGPAPPPYVQTLSFLQNATQLACYPAAAPPLPRPCEWSERHFETWLPLGLTNFELAKVGQQPDCGEHYLTPPGAWIRGR